MTDSSAVGGPGAGAARPGLIDRHDLVAALDHAAPGVRTIKTFGAPGPVARITVIR